MSEPQAVEPVETPESSNEDQVTHSEPTTRRIKVDGEYLEVPIKDLEAAYGLQKASNKRFEEAATLRKEVDALLEAFQSGDLAALSELVPEDSLYDYAESLLRKKIEWEETPEDKRARIIAERERDKLKEQLNEYTEKEQQQIVNYVNEQAAKEIDDEIGEALEKLSKDHASIVNTPEFVQDVARIMLAQLQNGAGSVDPEKAANLALKSWKNRFGSYAKGIKSTDLGTLFSKEQLKALRESELDEALGQFPLYGENAQPTKSKKKTSRTSVEDFFKKLDGNF